MPDIGVFQALAIDLKNMERRRKKQLHKVKKVTRKK
jgi:hypothetical protein